MSKRETNGREMEKGNIPFCIPDISFLPQGNKKRREQKQRKNIAKIPQENIFILYFRDNQDICNRATTFVFQYAPLWVSQSKITVLTNPRLGELIEEYTYLSGCMISPKYWSQLWFSVWGERMTQLFRKNNYVNRSKWANGQNALMN